MTSHFLRIVLVRFLTYVITIFFIACDSTETVSNLDSPEADARLFVETAESVDIETELAMAPLIHFRGREDFHPNPESPLSYAEQELAQYLTQWMQNVPEYWKPGSTTCAAVSKDADEKSFTYVVNRCLGKRGIVFVNGYIKITLKELTELGVRYTVSAENILTERALGQSNHSLKSEIEFIKEDNSKKTIQIHTQFASGTTARWVPYSREGESTETWESRNDNFTRDGTWTIRNTAKNRTWSTEIKEYERVREDCPRKGVLIHKNVIGNTTTLTYSGLDRVIWSYKTVSGNLQSGGIPLTCKP